MSSGYRKTIVCFADSRKLGARCVAGRELDPPHRWVRPVSPSPKGELSNRDCELEKGSFGLLDIIDIKMKEPRPQPGQPENHMIDQGYYWTREGKVSWIEACGMRDKPHPELWINGDSSYNGTNDRISTSKIHLIDNSLKLIGIMDLRLRVSPEGAYRGDHRLKVRGTFTHAGVSYALVVTDPIIEAEYIGRGAGEYEVGKALVCLSVSEENLGFVYKLIAGVVLPP